MSMNCKGLWINDICERILLMHGMLAAVLVVLGVHLFVHSYLNHQLGNFFTSVINALRAS